MTAEAHGLLGSRYFAGDPTVAKASIVANINMEWKASSFFKRFEPAAGSK